MNDLEKRIALIEARNRRVEADKAWETSTLRKISIILITYCFATLLMAVLGAEKPYLSALIPTMGFFLSTLSLEFIKRYWLNKKS